MSEQKIEIQERKFLQYLWFGARLSTDENEPIEVAVTEPDDKLLQPKLGCVTAYTYTVLTALVEDGDHIVDLMGQPRQQSGKVFFAGEAIRPGEPFWPAIVAYLAERYDKPAGGWQGAVDFGEGRYAPFDPEKDRFYIKQDEG